MRLCVEYTNFLVFFFYYFLVNDQHSNTIVILMMDIYQLAVQFFIPRLEQVCIQYLEFKISKKNVLDALYNADKMKY